MPKNTYQRIVLTVLIAGLLSDYSAFAQKIKYKNLFPILQSKDYVVAEPLLIAYLQDTQDEANPYFYLGEILSGKLDSTAIFPTPKTYDSLADNAILAYKKAISLVDEKEVRKNDEFYMAYNRRDLRTGKFGIKISDIHLDYEEKIDIVLKRKGLVAQIHQQKKQIDLVTTALNGKTESLVSKFQDEQSFYFQSNSEDHQNIQVITSEFAELEKLIEDYISKLKSLNNSLHHPQLEVNSISRWTELGVQQLDLESSPIVLIAIDEFLVKKLTRVQNEILPLKVLLEKTDEQLNNNILIHQNLSDSSQIKQDTLPATLVQQLSQFDENALPLKVLKFKQQKKQLAILSNEKLFPVLTDSSNVFQRSKALSQYKLKLEEMLKTITSIQQSANEKALADFSFYFERLKPSFEGYFMTELTVAQKQLENVLKHCLLLESANQFFKYKNDTIYLTRDIAEMNKSEKVVDTLIEKEEHLIIAGQFANSPFIAKAGFDMQVGQLFKLDTVANFHQLIEIQQNLLFISKIENTNNYSQTLVLLSPEMEKLWSYKFTSPSLIHSAKVEAGIFFIYNAEGEVLITLNSSGKEIGN